jgi:hypothetical protein
MFLISGALLWGCNGTEVRTPLTPDPHAPALAFMDSTGTLDSLAVAKERIRKAYYRQEGWRVQQVWQYDDGSGISVQLRRPGGDAGLTFTIREPGSSGVAPLTCHEGWEQDGGVTPIGTCEYYNSHWQWALDLVMEKLMAGELTRWEIYTGVGHFTQFYLAWGEPIGPWPGIPWRVYLSMPTPAKPYIYVDPVPYLRRPVAPKTKRQYERSAETGRGEQ